MAKKARDNYEEERVKREMEIVFTLCEAFQKRGIESTDYLHKKLCSTKANSPGLLSQDKYLGVLREVSKELGVNYTKKDSLPRTFTSLLSHLKRKVESSEKNLSQISLPNLDDLGSTDDDSELPPKNNPELANYLEAMFKPYQ